MVPAWVFKTLRSDALLKSIIMSVCPRTGQEGHTGGRSPSRSLLLGARQEAGRRWRSLHVLVRACRWPCASCSVGQRPRPRQPSRPAARGSQQACWPPAAAGLAQGMVPSLEPLLQAHLPTADPINSPYFGLMHRGWSRPWSHSCRHTCQAQTPSTPHTYCTSV